MQKKRRLEVDWAYLLIRFFLPTLTDAECLAYANERNLRNVNPFATIMTKEDLMNLQKKGELDPADVDGFEKAVEIHTLAKKIAASSYKIKSGATVVVLAAGYTPLLDPANNVLVQI